MLIGISLGPGDPELLTIKATEALKGCSRVFVPGEMAADLVRPYAVPELLDFPMIEDQEELERIWRKNAEIVADAASSGSAAFACIGDVNTFSTFSHLERMIRENYRGIEIQTIPGVGVVPALASRFAAPLEGSFEVSDGSPQDTIIRIKATRPRMLAQELSLRGFGQFILGRMLCTAQESIIREDRPEDLPERSDYFSVLMARRRK
jgi:precorrin-2/cobalt-factor-2 C20-methyltransferase